MDKLKLLWYRLLSGGLIPARWLYGDLLRGAEIQAHSGRLQIEIVSHCWAYAHLQSYQLSSLLQHAPENADITMTVFHSEEDEITVRHLEFFGAQQRPGVTWNWQRLPREALFRRAIGRDQAARATTADWIWFTDCDLLFGPGCLDGLAAALQGRRDRLVYPRTEYLSALLPDDDPVLAKEAEPRIKAIDLSGFAPHQPSRATGPLQIVHGDIARHVGYCGQTPYFMQPVDRWAKTYEDRTFRWLINAQGSPIEVPAVYRIRHQSKGRYKDGIDSRLRRNIRLATDNRHH